MLCEIARKVEADDLERIQSLEHELGLTLVAFSCRSLEPAREARLQSIMEELGPQLQARPAQPGEAQLGRIRALEAELGLTLIAVEASPS
jgi:hypothetical protein